ncbi:MAG: hypothetical protein H5T69_21420, partial [Chloroflexi bacterium]|nr:hypothetical protein [Chloroflexota bacterium]
MYHLHFQVLVFLVKIVMIFFASSVSFVFANISSSSMEWIMLSSNKKTFIMYPSGKRFIPLGFNYDHDERGRLLEDYWITEWNKVVEDFREMKKLGANVVRIHLQFGKVMDSPTKFRVDSINQLKRLI